MTAPHVIDPARFLSEQLEQASPDLMRSMLTTFINALMSAEADAVCGAEYGARSQDRKNSRNDYRHRDFDTAALGHSIHPPLTDVTLGCWMGASILDLAGGLQARSGAILLVSAGLAAAGPTALAGTGDWADMTGAARRLGAVHALGTDIAIFLFLGSLIARLRGHQALGVRLGIAGNFVLAGAGFLGGHLALTQGTERRTT